MKYEDVMKSDVQKRFWSKVDIKDLLSCWFWKGSLEAVRKGTYLRGRFRIGGRRGRAEVASRVAWVSTHGDIPDGLFVLHKCDDPRCVNPSHLYLGTNKDNMRDLYERGDPNRSHGEKHYHALLTDEQAREVRRLYKARKMRSVDIGKKFGISRSTVWDIGTGRRWKHLEA